MKIHENILVFSKSSACFVKDKNLAMIYNPQMIHGCKPYISNKTGISSTNYDYKHSKPITTINNGERFPNDIIFFKRDKEKIHPTQKPVDLIRYLVRTYTNVGGCVLDNCMGSGTTAIACIREKRNFIGFELNKEYYDKACKRIQLEMAQPSLF
jgi:site-specific DNA-methyltransferase (adenine-specific)